MTNTPDPTSPEAVERFTQIYNGGLSWDIVSNHNGEWVRHSDYAALSAERERYLRQLTAGAQSINDYKARAEAAEKAYVEQFDKREAAEAELTAALGVIRECILELDELGAVTVPKRARAFLARHQKEVDT